MGSCCGAVGRAVASDNRDRGFKSSHQQYHLLSNVFIKLCRTDENKVKRGQGGRNFFKKLRNQIYFSDFSLNHSSDNSNSWKQ